MELLARGARVASHVRSHRRGEFSTVTEHMPAAHRAHLEWTPQRLIDWGCRMGLATGELIRRLLERYKHPEHGYRACLGLLGLAKRFGSARLEAACQIALSLGVCQYRHVREILVNNRDRVDPSISEWTSPSHANVRGPGYYQ